MSKNLEKTSKLSNPNKKFRKIGKKATKISKNLKKKPSKISKNRQKWKKNRKKPSKISKNRLFLLTKSVHVILFNCLYIGKIVSFNLFALEEVPGCISWGIKKSGADTNCRGWQTRQYGSQCEVFCCTVPFIIHFAPVQVSTYSTFTYHFKCQWGSFPASFLISHYSTCGSLIYSFPISMLAQTDHVPHCCFQRHDHYNVPHCWFHLFEIQAKFFI